jgi:hypothetical protein
MIDLPTTLCPSCGANLLLFEGTHRAECEYCKSLYQLEELGGLVELHRIGFTHELKEADRLIENSTLDIALNEQHDFSDFAPELDETIKYVSLSSKPTINDQIPTAAPAPGPPRTTEGHAHFQQQPKINRLSAKARSAIFGLLGFLFLCCLLIIVIPPSSQKSDENTTRQSLGPTPNSTVFYISLPATSKTAEGWEFTIEKLDIHTQLGDRQTENGFILLVLFGAENNSDKRDCIKMNEFRLTNDSRSYLMSSRFLIPAKDLYDRDYPGSFFGQCARAGETIESILAFDIDITEDELILQLQDSSVILGTIQAIRNPLPTPTPTQTQTPTQTTTITPTFTPTRTPTSTITPTPTPMGLVPGSNAQSSLYNVRSGPGTSHAVAWKQAVDETFALIGRNEVGDWLFIQLSSGDQGWVSASLVETDIDVLDLPERTDIVPTLTVTPTLTRTPTLTPSLTPTRTPSPTKPLSEVPPSGNFCGQNNQRGVCVGGLEYRNYVGYTSASKNGRFIVMGVVVKNISYSDISVNPFDFTIVMEDGRTYEHASETYYFNNALQGVTILPDTLAEGALVFYVPKDVGPRKIVVRGGIFESTIEIDLLKPK